MKIFFSIFLSFVLFGCSGPFKKPSPPDDLIPKEKMIHLTKELMMMESHLEMSYSDVSKFYKIMNASNDFIFQKANISRDQYTRSFDYYASDQKQMKEIYEGVLEDLKNDTL